MAFAARSGRSSSPQGGMGKRRLSKDGLREGLRLAIAAIALSAIVAALALGLGPGSSSDGPSPPPGLQAPRRAMAAAPGSLDGGDSKMVVSSSEGIQRTAAGSGNGGGFAQTAMHSLTVRKFTCKRLIWLTGLQVKTADGNDTNYMTSSSSYLRYYASAVLSARERAPSLLPVLVVLNSMPQDFVDWAESLGVLVLPHEVSFAQRMVNADSVMINLMASYARLDIPAVVEKVLERLPEYQRRQDESALRDPHHGSRASGSGGSGSSSGGGGGGDGGGSGGGAISVPRDVDLEHVIWTDPDVLFREDIDSCTLPRPPLVSIGPEIRPGSTLNCGVMYFNVAAYGEMLPAMLDYADSKNWKFQTDQDLLLRFMNEADAAPWREPWHRLTSLPDAYNYKPYWGEPEDGWLGLFQGLQQKTKVAIVHTHGPKPNMTLCVVDYLSGVVKNKAAWFPNDVLQFKQGIVDACNIHVALYLNEVLKIMAGAFKADGGAMYRWVLAEHQRLCPDACWLPHHTAHGLTHMWPFSRGQAVH
ncbi:hypothetical protein Rsub_06899 [Raphidocelis subcapitata]|uniref:Uncharacterized protein n=1 Tax=Raphidocelis subcapitata TaxID=307507 RepID=A0A2V0P7R8_9CHLO|nr:hypothetical protein Rsub_06899 [Raphidocelis subcapitata]|eukprot:GBF93900.1 hypothetical protein Rsub_06899 [Raphidocelis subcapitata]